MTAALSKIFCTIDRFIAELNQCQQIFSTHRESLEERLSITFTSVKPLARGTSRRPRRETKVHYQRKKAHRLYLDVLESFPHFYVPFIIACSPAACEGLDFIALHREFERKCRLKLTIRSSQVMKDFLTRTSRQQNFDTHPLFEILLGAFCNCVDTDVMDLPTRPVSAAENELCFTFLAAQQDATNSVFGDYIHGLIDCAPKRMQEKASSRLDTTECVQTCFARHNLIDGVVRINIGRASDVLNILFPSVRLPPQEPSGSDQNKDNAYYKVKGAHISGINELFSSKICEAINSSELRTWERQMLLADTTDCVTLEMSREDHYTGIIQVRIGYILGVPVLQKLYK